MIRKNLLEMYPGAALYGLSFNIMLMLDSILAGIVTGADGIAAVAIGVPGYGLPVALVYALIHGTSLRMIWAKGRANEEGFRRIFRGGLTFVAVMGLFFYILIMVFSRQLVLLSGGDMASEKTVREAVVYLRACAPIAFTTAISVVLQETLCVMGYQSYRALLNFISVLSNLAISIPLLLILPEGYKLAALGIGTSAAGFIQFVSGLVLLRMNDIRIRFRILFYRWVEIIETIRCGVPASADYIAENVVMGIQNNLVLSAFPSEPLILPTVEVVCNLAYFATGAIKGAAYAAAPLFGVFFALKDRSGIKKTWRESFLLGLFMSVLWAGLFYLCLPWLCDAYGMTLSEDIRRGMMICLVLAPFVHMVSLFTMYYETIRRFGLSLLFAIVPDSILYIILMAILIPLLGKDGIWFSVNGSQALGLLILLPLLLLFGPRSEKGANRLLLLPDDFSGQKLRASYEIDGSEERIEIALPQEERQYLHELSKRMLKTSEKVELTVYDVDGKEEIRLIGIGKKNDPRQNMQEDEPLYSRTTYTYVYKMNIIFFA